MYATAEATADFSTFFSIFKEILLLPCLKTIMRESPNLDDNCSLNMASYQIVFGASVFNLTIQKCQNRCKSLNMASYQILSIVNFQCNDSFLFHMSDLKNQSKQRLTTIM